MNCVHTSIQVKQKIICLPNYRLVENMLYVTCNNWVLLLFCMHIKKHYNYHAILAFLHVFRALGL